MFSHSLLSVQFDISEVFTKKAKRRCNLEIVTNTKHF